MGQLILIALATFVSEDLTCIATGALIASGMLGFLPGVLACVAGIFFGDLLLYFAGRLLGRQIVRWKPLRRILSEQKLDIASNWLAEHGASVVILSRFTPGLRLPTYVAAGVLRTRFWTFSLYFLVAAALWTPLLVGGSAVLGRSLPRLAYAGPALFLAAVAARRLRISWQTRRRLLGWFRRRTRWEFWPPWLAYLPVAPYILFLAIRHRSLTLFTVANPGIPSGGFVGESKSAILGHLAPVPESTVLHEHLSADARFRAVKEFLSVHDLSYPIVLKPDVGERGTGVMIARKDSDVTAYFRTSTGDTIVQRYVGGVEFGVFYYRYPHDSRGSILSITDKRFPSVTGDGVSTIRELVLRDERACCLAGMYLGRLKRKAEDVPLRGEAVPLAELGSHCRGAVFLDAGHLQTEGLSSAVDAIGSNFPGFYFGRFDVRASTLEDFQAGRFEILELNGVSAEATHIYDPSVGILTAYRVLFSQWRIAFEIGAHNRRAGWKPMPLLDLIDLVRFRGKPRRPTSVAGHLAPARMGARGE
jgi:membrane protein DedA with SNARE-associated domain